MNESSIDRQAKKGVGTRLVHAGRAPFEQYGFVNTPIWRGSTVLFPTVEELHARRQPYIYGTHGTPTSDALEKAWTEISDAAGTVLAPSGLAAIALALMTVVKAGDHILVSDSVYLPTRTFCDTMLRKFDVETQYYDPLIGADISALIKPNTTCVLVEAPGSQSFEIQDVPAICAVARRAGAASIMDNTWATPLYFPAHERGVDLSVDAGTKYLSGHSDLLLGLVSANDAWFPKLKATFSLMANCVGPEDIFLALRGMRTMAVRLKEAQTRGLALAQWLQDRPEVSRVLHPALPEHPGHAIFKRDFLGASGVFSIILKPCSKAALAAMLDGLELFGMGYSWGGFESLVIPFDCADYRTVTRWAPEGPALRFSVGLEDLDDLVEDLRQGFARLKALSV